MKISDIIITKRIRQDLGDLTTLKLSMHKHGLFYPVIINSKKHLIAGERRIKAAKELGWTEIDVIIKDLSPQDIIDIELSENVSRKEFTQKELVHGLKQKKKIHSNIFYRFINFIKTLWQKSQKK